MKVFRASVLHRRKQAYMLNSFGQIGKQYKILPIQSPTGSSV